MFYLPYKNIAAMPKSSTPSVPRHLITSIGLFLVADRNRIETRTIQTFYATTSVSSFNASSGTTEHPGRAKSVKLLHRHQRPRRSNRAGLECTAAVTLLSVTV